MQCSKATSEDCDWPHARSRNVTAGSSACTSQASSVCAFSCRASASSWRQGPAETRLSSEAWQSMASERRIQRPVGILATNMCRSLSVHFSGHFPGGPGLAATRMSPFRILSELRVTEVVVTTGAIKRAKLQSNRHHQQTNTQFFYTPDVLVTQPTVSKHWREKHMPFSECVFKCRDASSLPASRVWTFFCDNLWQGGYVFIGIGLFVCLLGSRITTESQLQAARFDQIFVTRKWGAAISLLKKSPVCKKPHWTDERCIFDRQ